MGARSASSRGVGPTAACLHAIGQDGAVVFALGRARNERENGQWAGWHQA
jgi:hypothetical protein